MSSITIAHWLSAFTTRIWGPKLTPCSWTKDVDSKLEYWPESGERWPFQGAQLELCAHRCSRPNVSIHLQLRAPSAAGLVSGKEAARDSLDSETSLSEGAASSSSASSSWPSSGSSSSAPKWVPIARPSASQEQNNRARHAHSLMFMSTWPTGPTGASFHCDRDPYAMVSKRRLCGKFYTEEKDHFAPSRLHWCFSVVLCGLLV